MLKVYTLQENEKWDNIVQSFSNYDVYYLSGYSKGFFIHGDGDPLLFFYEDSQIKGINVVFKRDIANDSKLSNKLDKNKYFDLTTPYGYGGWLIEGNGSLDNLDKEYSNWCKENNIISEIVRFHPLLNNATRVKDIYNVLDLGKTVSIDLIDEETIWNNIISKNKNVIRKAIKNNVIIKRSTDKNIIDAFVSIYNSTMDKDNADQYYYFKNDFYNSIFNDLKNNSEIFYAEYNNMIISAAIILKCNNRLTYHFSGSNMQYGSLAATNLLLYEVAKWGTKNGYISFHLGGGVGSKEDNLFKFKKAFYKGEDHQYSIGKKIFNEEIYQKLVDLRANEKKRENFFPGYRG